MNDPILLATRKLWSWAKSQDFRGHDPHDLLESPLLRDMPIPILRLAALQVGRRSHRDLHSLLKVPKAENAKGLALFVSGLLAGRSALASDWHDEACTLGERIMALQSANGGWGYPFAWQSRTHYVPKGKPNIVTTAFCGLAMIELYRTGPTEKVRASISRAVDYICDVIPHRRFAEGTGFGYAENDPQIVYNAALLGAELLAKASALLERHSLLETAKQVAALVMSKQSADGSWVYGMEPSQTWIDSFHTGFVIESLFAIGTLSHEPLILQSAERGFQYYLRTFVQPTGAIGYFSDRADPIDAHAVGQAISLLAHHRHIDEARKTALWATENLQSPDGCFYYQKHGNRVNQNVYMRWSNAWMFKGLSDLIAAS